MDRKIRVGAVSYLNTKPLIYGLEKGLMKDDIELVLDYPANIAQKLLNDEIDIGLVPVAIIPKLKEYHIVSGYGICSNGPVASVCLYSEVPVEEITEVYMDYQSRTSVRLARILLKEYWKVDPLVKDFGEDFSLQVGGTAAIVLIGDRALEQRGKTAYIYDLGQAWKDFTGLPFVYAAWISNKKLPEKFEQDFNAMNQYGLDRLEEVIKEYPYPYYDLDEYYRKNIEYALSPENKAGLDLYLSYLRKYQW
ncbi:menaquinone biosynthetic enzyme MqnA/MqnD family protein [Flavihumibacter profundi]|uniref:menaquinone biosynthetic enzyme MqnA/MqnD family protein n=1 Tax=Flavihumibacter profundi TaxID=2716883 RepID=UPI001CC6BA46|nr:menaquinone biosynthesis protein [Flavihumibacter profundi]MBZ5856373.1 menaquinone biosynthesis protein [Flavihumibacter profundi]